MPHPSERYEPDEGLHQYFIQVFGGTTDPDGVLDDIVTQLALSRAVKFGMAEAQGRVMHNGTEYHSTIAPNSVIEEIKNIVKEAIHLDLRAYNETRRINQLPPEILVEIFRASRTIFDPFAFDTGPEESWDVSPEVNPIVNASHVCSHWRECAFTEKELWSFIDLHTAVQKGEQGLVFLERSSPLLVDIHHFGIDNWDMVEAAMSDHLSDDEVSDDGNVDIASEHSDDNSDDGLFSPKTNPNDDLYDNDSDGVNLFNSVHRSLINNELSYELTASDYSDQYEYHPREGIKTFYLALLKETHRIRRFYFLNDYGADKPAWKILGMPLPNLIDFDISFQSDHRSEHPIGEDFFKNSFLNHCAPHLRRLSIHRGKINWWLDARFQSITDLRLDSTSHYIKFPDFHGFLGLFADTLEVLHLSRASPSPKDLDRTPDSGSQIRTVILEKSLCIPLPHLRRVEVWGHYLDDYGVKPDSVFYELAFLWNLKLPPDVSIIWDTKISQERRLGLDVYVLPPPWHLARVTSAVPYSYRQECFSIVKDTLFYPTQYVSNIWISKLLHELPNLKSFTHLDENGEWKDSNKRTLLQNSGNLESLHVAWYKQLEELLMELELGCPSAMEGSHIDIACPKLKTVVIYCSKKVKRRRWERVSQRLVEAGRQPLDISKLLTGEEIVRRRSLTEMDYKISLVMGDLGETVRNESRKY